MADTKTNKMVIEVKLHDDIKEIIIGNTSKLNIIIAERFKEEVRAQMETPETKLIINFENISFIDSSGFEALISILKSARKNNCRLCLCNISDELMDMFKIIHLHKIFDIEDSVNSCVNSLKNDE